MDTMKVEDEFDSNPPGFRFTPGVWRRVIQLLTLVALQALALFLPAGTLRWPEGWVYLGFYVFIIGLNFALLLRHGAYAAELIEERSHMTGMKSWDKVFAAVYGISGIATLVVAGLDQRFGWSPAFAFWIQAVALVVMFLGYGTFSWSMATNAFFSARVRIQSDRGHQVVSHGPYAIVRHPGYAGTIPFAFTLPLMLASYWALIPAAFLISSIVARTLLEDRTLLRELEGYREYAERVRFRLLPGIW
jgi:protein-S-isoprenylcysteine O-methyltransferase Ste14